MTQVLTIALAGAAGTISRYGLGLAVRAAQTRIWPGDAASAFPWPTLVVNLLGCFAFGLVFAMTEGSARLPESIRPWLLVGFMGAFTTFSTFEFESLRLLQSGTASLPAVIAFLAYVGLSVLVGLGACYAGMRLGQVS